MVQWTLNSKCIFLLVLLGIWDIFPGVVFLCHINSISSFWGMPSKKTWQSTFHHWWMRVLFWSHTYKYCLLFFLMDAMCTEYDVIFHCCFELDYSNHLWFWEIFQMFCGHLCFFLDNSPIYLLSPFMVGMFYSCRVLQVLYISWILTFCWMSIKKISPSLWVICILVIVSFEVQILLSLM